MAFSTRPSRATSQATRRVASRPKNVDVPTVVGHALGTALLAAVIGLAIAVICSVSAWALAPHADGGGPDTSARLAVMAWLLAHHVAIDLPAGVLSLTPLGLLLLPLGLCYASGRQLSRALRPGDLGAVGRVIGLFALAYAVIAAVVAGVSAGDGLRPHPLGAFVAASVIALLGGGLGMLRASGLLPDVVERVPFAVRQVLAGAAAGLAVVVGIGALLLALMLAAAFPEALEVTRAFQADLLGAVLLTLLGIALLPNLVLWLLAFTTGVGFQLGAGSPVTPQAVEYGPLPVLPPLAALPPEGPLPAWALLVLVVPLAAGAVVGAVVHRRTLGLPSEQAGILAGSAGLTAGAALGLLAGLSAGSAGADRMATLGPVGWQVGVVAAVEMGVVAAVVAWECSRRKWDGKFRWVDSLRGWVRRDVD